MNFPRPHLPVSVFPEARLRPRPSARPPSRGARGLAVRFAAALLALAALAPPARAGAGVWSGASPRAKSIEAIARDPLNPLRLWAASFGAGIYRSVDGGATWTDYRAGLVNTFTRCLAVEPHHPDSVFCGTNDGVFLSVDGGVNWNKMLSTAHSVRAIAIHPIRTGTIYATTSGSGIYKSLNAGKNWSTINLGLVNTTVRDIALHPTKPDTLLAGTGTGGGVHRSFNGGLTWTQLPDTTGSNDGTHGAVEQIVYDPLDAQRVYVAEFDRGVLHSSDGGNTWARTNAGLTTLRERSIAVVDTLRYLGSDGASASVFFTTLNDVAWHPTGAGIANPVVDALLSSSSSPSNLLAGTDGGGISSSPDRGATWSTLDGGLLSTFSFSLAVRASTHEVYDGSGFGDQFWKSANNGASWTRAAYLFTHDSEHGVAPDPLAANTVYLSAYGGGVYVSADDGATWSNPDSLNGTLTNRFVRPLVAVVGQSGHLFVGTGIGPFETLDGGANWVSRVGDLPASFAVHSLALVPGSPATIYVGSDSAGVYKTVDGGGHWAAQNSGLVSPFIHALVVDAASSATIYAATDSGVFRSTNSGGSWTRASAGLPAFEVHGLAQDAVHNGMLFAGSFGAGVFQSWDQGASWNPVFGQNGLTSLNVRCLALDPALRTIYAGTDNGVAVASSYGVLDSPAPARATFALTAWPNPAGPDGVRLNFTLPRAQSVRLEILDVAGRRVRLLEAGERTAGEHEARWDGRTGDGRAATPGLYFARLAANDGVRTVHLVRLGR